MKIKGIFYLIRKFKVPSRKQKGRFYLVELYSDNSLECDCLAGQLKRNCYHKSRVRDYLSEKRENK